MCNMHDHLKSNAYQIIDTVGGKVIYMTNCFDRLCDVLASSNRAIDTQREVQGYKSTLPRYTSRGPHQTVGNAEAQKGLR